MRTEERVGRLIEESSQGRREKRKKERCGRTKSSEYAKVLDNEIKKHDLMTCDG